MKHNKRKRFGAFVLSGLLLFLFILVASSMADGMTSAMPEPPEKPAYWQLARIEQEPLVEARGGYAVAYASSGLDLDLSDPLMAESIVLAEDALMPEVRLTIGKDGTQMEHVYRWTPLPVFLAKNTVYEIELSGHAEASPPGITPNSLLTAVFQGTGQTRISAGEYTNHAREGVFAFSTDAEPFRDNSFVISMSLRDTNDMFTLRTVYTYERVQGLKPEPTPVPGFVAVSAPEGVAPSYYVPVEGQESLFQVITEPDVYRAYGEMNGSDPMFFPADAEGNVAMNEKPASTASDFANLVQGFHAVEPETLPSHYQEMSGTAYGFISRDGEDMLRAYGRVDGESPAFYPVDEATGEVDVSAPADPEADYGNYIEGFGFAVPANPYQHYKAVQPGLYSFTGRDGEMRFRAYGRLDGEAPTYYEASESGELAEDAVPIAPESDFEAYIEGFDPLAPAEVPPFYEEKGFGLFVVLDQEAQPIFRVHGVLDGAPPAYYPADESGEIIENAQPVTPDADYEAYVAGFVPGETGNAPAFYNQESGAESLYSFVDREGKKNYRAYGELNRGEAQFYPADEDGNVARDALPVDPASDLALLPAPAFAAQVPEEVPAHYEAVPNQEGLYTFDDRDGAPQLRVYGAFGADMPYFYPATEEGKPLEKALPISPMQDYTDYFEGFEPMTPETVPSQYLPVDGVEGLYAYDLPGEPIYRVYGSLNREEPMFFISDEAASPLEPIDPALDIIVLPTPLATAITSPAPTETAPDQIRRDIPAATAYAREVVPAVTPGNAPDVVSRDMPVSALPEATAYAASVTTGAPVEESPGIVSREVAVEATPEATQFEGVVITGAPETEGTDAVSRVQATPTDKETPGPTGEVTQQAISRAVVDASGEVATDAPTDDPTLETASPAAESEAPVETPVESPPEEATPVESTEPEATAVPATAGGVSGLGILAIIAGVLVVGGGGYFVSRKKK